MTARLLIRPGVPAKWRPMLPDLTQATKAFDGPLTEAYEEHARGGKGAMGSRSRAIDALADLKAEDLKAAVEAGPRWLRAVKAARKTPLTVENYVRDETWKNYPPPTGDVGERVQLPVRSLEWHAYFWRLAMLDKSQPSAMCRGMLRDAAFGKGWWVKPDDTPTRAEIDAMAMPKIQLDSEEFILWRRYLTGDARKTWIPLKGEAFGTWLWVPAVRPPSEFSMLAEARREEEKT